MDVIEVPVDSMAAAGSKIETSIHFTAPLSRSEE
jgi:hypothetical protein